MSSAIDLGNILSDLGPRFAEAAEENDAGDRFVLENYEALRQSRVFSALVPDEFGGAGIRHADMCEFLRALAGYCPATALALSMHQHLVAAAVANNRAGRPGRALLEEVGGGERVLVSTGASDWLDSNGRAERAEGGYRVTATKPFASGAPAGDIIVTSAVHEGPDGAEVLHFALPLKAEGVSLVDDWRALGMRATGSQTVRLDNVFVPDGAIGLRRPRGPFHPAFAVILTVAMPLIMSVYLGAAESAFAVACRHTLARKSDAPTSILIGEAANHLAQARLAVGDLVRLVNDYDFRPDAQLASDVLVRKTLAANAVIATAGTALQAAGGAGFYRKLGLERLLRDVHGARFHPLPEKRQQLFTGRLALGLEPVSD
jgi:acyl-CoA dehydrogenase